VLELDERTRTARVEPGTVHATLQQAVRPLGLRFGPDPSSHTRCTIGGMIGNNACGSRALGYGRTVDNVAGVRALTAGGDELVTGFEPWSEAGFEAGAEAGFEARSEARPQGRGRAVVEGPASLLDDLHTAINSGLAVARTEFGRFGRQVSGYAVDSLLPERGFDVTGLLVGSEGTLAVVTEATVRLVADPAVSLLVVLGYPDFGTAGDVVPALLKHRPTACEGIDSRIVQIVRERRGPGAVPPLPGGTAWLFVEISDADLATATERAQRLIADAGAVDALVVADPKAAAPLWRIREDGAGLAGRAPSGKPGWAGWEDAAVPPERIGDYLRASDELFAQHGLSAMPYGHLGDGCVHVRLDFPFEAADGPARFRAFLFEAADLVASFGGSLSGEHGDGRARSELLPRMYSAEAIGLFGAVKTAFDPSGLLNPGVLVDPDPVDAAIRAHSSRPVRVPLAFGYHADAGDFGQAVHRCTGVGKCRAETRGSTAVMCPSYLATREEKDSTRGRARVLQEMLDGDLAPDWRAPAVHEALDLCLSCKGCASDCPTGVDMATWKSEVLHQSYRRRWRPRSHYALGWLPRWARLVAKVPGGARVVNRMTTLPGLRRAGLFLAGVDARRTVPAFADETFRAWFARRPAAAGNDRPVMLFVDSFTDHFSPEVGRAAVRVLESAGHQVRISSGSACCALTWITTGQLDAARRILGRTADELADAVAEGLPVVGLEPSCTATLRSDLPELLDSDNARAVAAATRTLAELLAADPNWTPPSLAGTRVVAQPHCHHHAVMGWDADAKLLARAGADVQRLGGCCGLAGNFGVERGHYDVSVAVAGAQLLPALADLGEDGVLLADGFSCRTQAADLAQVPGRHLAELLAPATDD
jgi:FAD/FMN-containing dehydrogenase/Fe-S oxidoreductase